MGDHIFGIPLFSYTFRFCLGAPAAELSPPGTPSANFQSQISNLSPSPSPQRAVSLKPPAGSASAGRFSFRPAQGRRRGVNPPAADGILDRWWSREHHAHKIKGHSGFVRKTGGAESAFQTSKPAPFPSNLPTSKSVRHWVCFVRLWDASKKSQKFVD